MNASPVSGGRLPVCFPALLLLLVLVSGCRSGEEQAAAPSAPPAPVITATTATLDNPLQVAGEFLPMQEIELHAKVAGYIKRITVDIGDHVRQGQVIATLDVPELVAQVQGATSGVRQTQEQITRAQSQVRSAEAAAAALHSSAQRLQQVSQQQPGLIAAQELEDARAKDLAAAAQVDAAKSALLATQQSLGVSQAQRTQVASMADYSRIVAPFSGVITQRYADTGALIQAGTSNAGSMPVVKLAQVDVLRLRIPVPESLTPFVHTGQSVDIAVSALNKRFTGTIVRDTASLDPATRTMQVEVDVPNPNGELQPGMYAQVNLQVHRAAPSVVVPVGAVDTTGPQPFVLLVDSSNHVQKHIVQTGFSAPNRTEILSGLSAGDRIISTNLGAYNNGELVRPQADTMAAAAEGK